MKISAQGWDFVGEASSRIPQQAVGRGGGSSSGGFDVNSSYKLHAQSA
jgi:hypothetical protein